VRHRGLAVAGWLLAVVALVAVGSALGTRTLKAQDWQVGQDARASATLRAHGLVDADTENVLIQRPARAPDGMLADPDVRAAVADVVRQVVATRQVTEVRAPLAVAGATAEPGLVSADGRSVMVTFDLVGTFDDAGSHVGPTLTAVATAAHAHPGLSVEQVGEASAAKALNGTVGRDFQRAEWLAIPLTIAILLVVFGALVAALVPVALAMTAFAGAIGVVALTSRLMATNQIATSVMLLIGLAVGVDYALFYIRRERAERAAGHSARRALEIAAETSGHAVLVSGLTVAVSMAGLMISGMAAFTGIAVGTIVVVLVSLLGSISVLPALLSLFGDRIELGRLPWRRPAARLAAQRAAEAEAGRAPTGSGRAADPSRPGLLEKLMRRPVAVAAVSGGLLVALALPALRLHTADLGVQDLPQSLPMVKTYDRLQTAFPGGPAPATIVVSAPDVTAPAVTAAIADLRAQAVAAHVGFEPAVVDVSTDKKVARVLLPLAGNGTDQASLDAARKLRADLVPATIDKVPGAHADVGGNASDSLDFHHQLLTRTPIVIAFVLALAFALLLVAFRSAAIAGLAVALNLISVGAAYGLLELVFQHTWAEGLLGFRSAGAIENWLPLMLFVMLFGLSMDYQVLLLSRVREARMRGLTVQPPGPSAPGMRAAVIEGLRRSAGVVTSAAVIMVAVFGVFATLSQVSMKQLGVGLGAAVFLDATVIRVFLMPALLTLVGDRVWRPRTPAARGPAAGPPPTQPAGPAAPTRVARPVA
jgi:RND superfamily putative drug exporter